MSADKQYIEAYKVTSELFDATDTADNLALLDSLSGIVDSLKAFQGEKFDKERLANLAQAYLVSLKAFLEVKTKVVQGQDSLDNAELVLAIQMNDAKREIDNYIALDSQSGTADRPVWLSRWLKK